MLYPVYLHVGDERHAHGISIPDFPGCFSAADSWEGLPQAIQEAAEVFFEGEETEIPAPTPIERLALDPAYQGGAWMLAEIDVSKLGPSSGTTSATAAPAVLSTAISDAAPDFDMPCVVQEPADRYHESKGSVSIEVTLPEDLLEVIDYYAKTHRLSRSALLARAAGEFIAARERK
jgi:predicted RNase H-like HicB family nuclease